MAVGTYAQTVDSGAQRAEQLFSYMLVNLPDSLYDALAPRVRPMITRDRLRDGMAHAESIAGKYVRHAEWTRSDVDSIRVYTSLVTFEKEQLNCIISLDTADRMLGIRLVPPALPVLRDTDAATLYPLPDGAIEIDDTVRTNAITRLPATVTLSGNAQNPPIVVMVHGSGPMDRDETVFANKTFRDLSCQLVARGVSTLRYDKRTLVYRDTVRTIDDETIDDALSAIRLAHEYSDRVYVLGHSLGAMVAPLIAERAADSVSGIIMMAAPARDMISVVRQQVEVLMPGEATEADRRQAIDALRRQAPHYFLPQHQVETAAALTTPVLIMQGERDYQVTMDDFRLWKQALGANGNVTLRSYPALNHIFTEGEGQSTPQEYMVRKDIPEVVIDDICRFIRNN